MPDPPSQPLENPRGESELREIRTKVYASFWYELELEAARMRISIAALNRIILTEWMRHRKEGANVV